MNEQQEEFVEFLEEAFAVVGEAAPGTLQSQVPYEQDFQIKVTNDLKISIEDIMDTPALSPEEMKAQFERFKDEMSSL